MWTPSTSSGGSGVIPEGLKPVRDIAEGIEATKIPKITDGDFLFTV